MKYLLLLFVTISSFGQITKVEDNQIKIEYKWAREIVNKSIWTPIRLNSETDILKNIFIKLKMSSINKEEKIFEINKFILIDEKNKLKIRPNNISYQPFTQAYSFTRLSTDNNIKDKKNRIYYSDSVIDYFKEFEFPEYKNLEIPINYGNRKEPEIHITYFWPDKFKKANINLFFAVPAQTNSATLFYGNQKIAEIKY